MTKNEQIKTEIEINPVHYKRYQVYYKQLKIMIMIGPFLNYNINQISIRVNFLIYNSKNKYRIIHPNPTHNKSKMKNTIIFIILTIVIIGILNILPQKQIITKQNIHRCLGNKAALLCIMNQNLNGQENKKDQLDLVQEGKKIYDTIIIKNMLRNDGNIITWNKYKTVEIQQPTNSLPNIIEQSQQNLQVKVQEIKQTNQDLSQIHQENNDNIDNIVINNNKEQETVQQQPNIQQNKIQITTQPQQQENIQNINTIETTDDNFQSSFQQSTANLQFDSSNMNDVIQESSNQVVNNQQHIETNINIGQPQPEPITDNVYQNKQYTEPQTSLQNTIQTKQQISSQQHVEQHVTQPETQISSQLQQQAAKITVEQNNTYMDTHIDSIQNIGVNEHKQQGVVEQNIINQIIPDQKVIEQIQQQQQQQQNHQVQLNQQSQIQQKQEQQKQQKEIPLQVQNSEKGDNNNIEQNKQIQNKQEDNTQQNRQQINQHGQNTEIAENISQNNVERSQFLPEDTQVLHQLDNIQVIEQNKQTVNQINQVNSQQKSEEQTAKNTVQQIPVQPTTQTQTQQPKIENQINNQKDIDDNNVHNQDERSQIKIIKEDDLPKTDNTDIVDNQSNQQSIQITDI